MNDMFDHPTPPKPQDPVPANAQAASEPSLSTSHPADGSVAHSAPPSPSVLSEPAEAGPQQLREQPSSNLDPSLVTQPAPQPTTQPEGSQVRSQPGTASGVQPSVPPVAEPSTQPNPLPGVQTERVAGTKPDPQSGAPSSNLPGAKPGPPAGRQPASQSGTHSGAQPGPQSARQGAARTREHPSTGTATRNPPAHPASSNGPSTASACGTDIANWSNLSPAQKQAYFEDTNRPRSRKKPRPSLDRHRDFILECVEGKAKLSRVFYDLCALDPALIADFGAKGHRRFGDAVKDMIGK